MIDQGLLDEPVFAFYLGNADKEGDESEAVFGGVNKDHYTGKLIEIPLRRKAYWEVDLDAITLATRLLSSTTPVSFLTPEPLSLLSHPPSLSFSTRRLEPKKSYNGQYTIECEKRDSLPDMTFTLSGYNFSITPYDYILEVQGSCISSFMGMDIQNQRTFPFSPMRFDHNTNFYKQWPTCYPRRRFPSKMVLCLRPWTQLSQACPLQGMNKIRHKRMPSQQIGY